MIPNEVARWRRNHYHVNCIRDVGRSIATVLAALDAQDQDDRAVVVFTADHGGMDGAHQRHAKGAVSWREQNHVPFVVVDDACPGGR